MKTILPPPAAAGASATLADWLWASARELQQQRPGPARDQDVLQAMQARFAQSQAARPRSRWSWRWAGPSLCASVLLACGWLISLAPPGESGAAAPMAGRGSDFIVLVSAERWADYQRAGSAATAWLVPTEMPRERLALLGLPYDPAAAAEPVHAELLVHASGDVLAMRVLP